MSIWTWVSAIPIHLSIFTLHRALQMKHYEVNLIKSSSMLKGEKERKIKKHYTNNIFDKYTGNKFSHAIFIQIKFLNV